jgi:hypothetical protein
LEGLRDEADFIALKTRIETDLESTVTAIRGLSLASL